MTLPTLTPSHTRLAVLLIALPALAQAEALPQTLPQPWSDDPTATGVAAPQPVSPSAVEDTARIAETCPTFSWGAVDGAQRYELAIYDALWNPSTDAQAQQQSAEPLRAIAIDAPATAWTASGAQCLEDVVGYVWFVRAETATGPSPWSQGAQFEVDFGSDALSEAVRRELTEQLKRPEVWRDGLEQVLGDPALSPQTLLRNRTVFDAEEGITPRDSDPSRLSTAEALSLLSTPAPQAAATSFPHPSAFRTSGPNGVVLGGTDREGGIPAEGAGTRLMWYPGKVAFRVGGVTGEQWDDTNVGRYSVAMGYNTTASEFHSTAMGLSTTASGNWSTAMGSGTTASGLYSTAMGDGTNASGPRSTAMGGSTTAQVALGQRPWVSAPPHPAPGQRPWAGAQLRAA